MKKYIKTALLISAFLYMNSSNATIFYFYNNSFLGNPNKGFDIFNWQDLNGSFPNDFQQNTDTFDLNGFNVDFESMQIGNVHLQNSNSTAVTLSNSGTLYIVSALPPTIDYTNLTFGINSSPSIVAYDLLAGSSFPQTIAGWNYFDLYIGTPEINILSSAASIADTLTLRTNVTLKISANLTFGTLSNIRLWGNNDNGTIQLETAGSITNNRTSGINLISKNYIHNSTNNIYDFQYNDLEITQSCSASSNIAIGNTLTVGDGTNNVQVTIGNYTLTVNKLVQRTNGYVDLRNSNLIISNTSLATYSSATFNYGINNLEYSGAANCIFDDNITIAGSIQLKGSSTSPSSLSTVSGKKIIFTGFNLSRSGNNFDITGSTNYFNFQCSTSNIITIPSSFFKSSTVSNLVIDFTNGGTVKLASSTAIINLDMSATPSSGKTYLDINNVTLSILGTSSISDNNVFYVGANNSILNLIRSFPTSGVNTHILKFDQTSSTNYALKSLSVYANISVELKSNLNIGTSSGSLVLNSNTTNTCSFKIGNFTLEISGNLTSSTTSARFIGGPNSNLIFSRGSTVTGLVYFDQSLPENRLLKNLSINGNNTVVTLGNWLDISGGTSSSGYGIVDVVAASAKLYTQGYLTLKSNQYGTAMISSSPGNIAYNSSSNNGTLLMENYIAGNSTKGRQYRFLSSPVSGGVFWQWRDSSNSRSGRGTHITGKTGTVNIANDSFDISTTNHPSAFYYDETKAGNTTGIGNTSASEDAGWSRLINAKTGTIENGKGYRVLIRGDRSITLTSSTTTTPVNTTIQTRGGYVAGPVSVPITNSSTKTNNGINLVGNPYACAVDWVTVQSNSTSVDPTYVAFDVSSKSYQSYNATSGGGLMSRYISPGQGFLVYTTAASTNLVFPTTSKTTAQAGGRIFTEIKNNHLVTRLMKDSGTYDATIIYFIKGATNYYDAYDAGHIENSNVNLSSLDSTNTLYNLNCMDSLIGTRIIPLSLYGTPTGTYTMAFDDVNTFKNHDVYLIDNYLQKTTKVDDMTQYQVNVNTDKFSYAEGRFAISFEHKPMTSVVTLNKTDIFNISPNPVKDQLNVKMDNQLMGTIEYEIFNISGQSMMSGAFNSKETKINTSKLTTGIYFINLRANNETQTIKFIK